jgi:hypothetical protein
MSDPSRASGDQTLGQVLDRLSVMEARYRDTIVDVAETLTCDPLYVAPRPRSLHALYWAALGRAPHVPRIPRPRHP